MKNEAEPRGVNWGQGIQYICDLFIKRHTAMGSLGPTLFLVPIFLLAAGALRENEFVSGLFSFTAVIIVLNYLLQFQWFKIKAIDRLQSEEHRQIMTRLQHRIDAKGLSSAVLVETVSLPGATKNPASPDPASPGSHDALGHKTRT